MRINNRSSGMTLVEILLVLGIAGLISIQAGTYILQSEKMKNLLVDKQGVQQLSEEIAASARNGQLCKMYNLRFPAPSTYDPATASSAQGQDVVANMSGVTIGAEGTAAVYGIDKTHLKIANTRATGMSGENGDPLYQGVILLSGQYARSNIGSGQIPSRSVSPLVFSVNGGQISGCYGDSPAPSTNCEIDPTSEQCKSSPLPQQSCLGNQIATGYINGVLQCRSVSSTCPTGQIVTGIANGITTCGVVQAAAPTPSPPTGGSGKGDLPMLVAIGGDPKCFTTSVHIYDFFKACDDFDKPAQMAARLGMPECGVPKIGEKCFARTHTISMGADGSGPSEFAAVTIYVGIPVY